MAKKIQLVPTILSQTFAEFEEKLHKVENLFKLIQVDCMDNKFVKNKTFYDVKKIKTLKSYKGDYELHLMVKDPLKVIKEWQSFKQLKKVIFHFESFKKDDQVWELLKVLKKKRFEIGLAIKPETSASQIIKFLPELDLVFLMGVAPGWGGQELQPETLNKARLIRLKNAKIDIEIDGGVNLENIPKIVQSGINIISAGTMIFGAEDVGAVIKEFDGLIT